MEHENFCMWLHGWTELNSNKMPDEAQWKMICEHLDLCFTKVTSPLEGFNESGNKTNSCAILPLDKPTVFC